MARPHKPDYLKIVAGTNQPCRMLGNEAVELPLAAEVPPPPLWLSNQHAAAEWNRLAPILHGVGLLTEGGLTTLGVMCSLFGKICQLYAAGESPTGHMIAQYRGLANDFGLTPVAQGKVKPSGEKEKGNRFASNGKR
jgi:phage terminase small subunit